MNNTFLSELLREYDEIQRIESRALILRREEAFNKIPGLEKIHQEIIEEMAKNSKRIILGSQNSAPFPIEDLQSKINELKAVENGLLAEYGYPHDYLQMHYRCQICKDTGYVGYPLREKCPCLIQRLLEKTYRMSNINELEKENFETFNPLVFPERPLEKSKMNQREYMVELKDRLLNYLGDFPQNEKRTMLFTGKTGLGKTFLLNSIAKSVMDMGYTAIRISAYKLFDQLFYKAISSGSDNLSLKRHLFEVDALIIDDLGTETRRNNYTTEDLFNIINERGQNRSHTFLSTNLSLKNLRDRYSDRITSRLFDSSNTMIIRFEGADIRLERNNQ